MLSIVIQAGGESRRMGQDKALLPFLGKPLIQRVITRLVGLADEILITTNRPSAYQSLGYRLETDLIPGRGALGGLYTALSVASHPLVAVVACDMPFVSPTLLIAERERLETGGFDAVIPQTDAGSEPFHAVYRRQTCLPAIRMAIEADRWRVDAWYPQVSVYLMPPDELRQLDPTGRAFWNVNTPEEFRRAEEIARQTEGE